MVFEVGCGEQNLGLAFFGDCQTIPQQIDTLAGKFGFLGVPVDRLERRRDAQALGGFLGEIDIEADDFILLIAEAHRREVVVQADDDGCYSSWSRGWCGCGCLGGFFLLAAGNQ